MRHLLSMIAPPVAQGDPERGRRPIPSLEGIALIVGAAPERVSRKLSELDRDALLSSRRRDSVVVDRRFLGFCPRDRRGIRARICDYAADRGDTAAA